jgi:hypothetical protein
MEDDERLLPEPKEYAFRVDLAGVLLMESRYSSTPTSPAA